jgi:hypothetical protein
MALYRFESCASAYFASSEQGSLTPLCAANLCPTRPAMTYFDMSPDDITDDIEDLEAFALDDNDFHSPQFCESTDI